MYMKHYEKDFDIVLIMLLINCYTVTWLASQGLDKLCVYQSDITSGHHWQYYQYFAVLFF